QEFFESKIRPVLVEKCYQCHSSTAAKLKGGLKLDSPRAVLKGGASGPAVVPGKPEESLLLQAISRGGDFSSMPPNQVLSGPVVGDFRRWIAMGAPDPRDAVGLVSKSASGLPVSDRKSTWWSLLPISSPPVPRLAGIDAAWARTPIDAFIVARL